MFRVRLSSSSSSCRMPPFQDKMWHDPGKRDSAWSLKYRCCSQPGGVPGGGSYLVGQCGWDGTQSTLPCLSVCDGAVNGYMGPHFPVSN